MIDHAPLTFLPPLLPSQLRKAWTPVLLPVLIAEGKPLASLGLIFAFTLHIKGIKALALLLSA